MSWRDRQYASFEYDRAAPQGGMATGWGRLGRGLVILLAANAGMAIVSMLTGKAIFAWLAVVPHAWWQPWRYLTFQFLHADLMHLLFNMIGLYFLGEPLERAWGTRRFLWFYLGCGACAGLAHVVIGLASGFGQHTQLVGASGGVYAVVLACAVLFPQYRIFFIPIRWAAGIFLGLAVLNVVGGFSDGSAMNGGVSDIAHLGGAAAGAVWLWVGRGAGAFRLPRIFSGRKGAWERKMRKRAQEEARMDGILQKIHDRGLGSLSWPEKRILRSATQHRRDERGPFTP
jgi:membrane associated rhomboid family serine protease